MICFWYSVQNQPKRISRWNLGKQESIISKILINSFLTTQNWTRFPNTNDASLPPLFATAIVCCKAPLCWTKDWCLTKASENENLIISGTQQNENNNHTFLGNTFVEQPCDKLCICSKLTPGPLLPRKPCSPSPFAELQAIQTLPSSQKSASRHAHSIPAACEGIDGTPCFFDILLAEISFYVLRFISKSSLQWFADASMFKTSFFRNGKFLCLQLEKGESRKGRDYGRPRFYPSKVRVCHHHSKSETTVATTVKVDWDLEGFLKTHRSNQKNPNHLSFESTRQHHDHQIWVRCQKITKNWLPAFWWS